MAIFTSGNVMWKEVAKAGFNVTVGAGITLAGLLAWTGTTDLQSIKDAVQTYVDASEEQTNALLGEYNQVVVDANAEIADYIKALEKANGNITALLKEKEQLQDTITNNMVAVEEANEIIAKANEQINAANEEVAQAKTDVNNIIGDSQMVELVEGWKKETLYTEGSKEVIGIDGVAQPETPVAPDQSTPEQQEPTEPEQQELAVSLENLGKQNVNLGSSPKTETVYKATFTDGTVYYVTRFSNGDYVGQVDSFSTDGKSFTYMTFCNDEAFKTTYKPLIEAQEL